MTLLNFKYFKYILLLSFLSYWVAINYIVIAEETVVKQEVIMLGDNIVIASSLSKFESVSRDSAVKVLSPAGVGSGTYFKIEKRHVVITAAHVIDDFTDITIVGRDNEMVKGEPVFIDKDNDFAVISLQSQMKSRKSASFRPIKEKISDMVGKKIFYTGSPNRHDLLTIRGTISGSERGFLILQSYAWKGASGSCVFDEFGNIVGILTGVEVGAFDGSYHLIPSMVWIIPIQNIEGRLLKSVIKQRIPI